MLIIDGKVTNRKQKRNMLKQKYLYSDEVIERLKEKTSKIINELFRSKIPKINIKAMFSNYGDRKQDQLNRVHLLLKDDPRNEILKEEARILKKTMEDFKIKRGN